MFIYLVAFSLLIAWYDSFTKNKYIWRIEIHMKSIVQRQLKWNCHIWYLIAPKSRHWIIFIKITRWSVVWFRMCSFHHVVLRIYYNNEIIFFFEFWYEHDSLSSTVNDIIRIHGYFTCRSFATFVNGLPLQLKTLRSEHYVFVFYSVNIIHNTRNGIGIEHIIFIFWVSR